MKKALLLLLLLVITVAVAFPVKTRSKEIERWNPPFTVPEYFNSSIPSAGYTGFDMYGRPYILYNPGILANAPWYLHDYTRAHEHGHVYCIQAFGDRSEICADYWAGDQLGRTNPALLDMVIWFYETQVRERRFSHEHPSGYELAKILRSSSRRSDTSQ